jgi:hypothetical protein
MYKDIKKRMNIFRKSEEPGIGKRIRSSSLVRMKKILRKIAWAVRRGWVSNFKNRRRGNPMKNHIPRKPRNIASAVAPDKVSIRENDERAPGWYRQMLVITSKNPMHTPTTTPIDTIN